MYGSGHPPGTLHKELPGKSGGLDLSKLSDLLVRQSRQKKGGLAETRRRRPGLEGVVLRTRRERKSQLAERPLPLEPLMA